MNLPTLPADKVNHALYGALIFLVAGAIAAEAGQAPMARATGAGAMVCWIAAELTGG